jgi:hypothetical protein
MIDKGLISFILLIIILLFLTTLPSPHHSKKRLFERLKQIDPNWSNLFFKTYFFSKITEHLYKNSTGRPDMNPSGILILINRKLFEKYNDSIINKQLKIISRMLIVQLVLIALMLVSIIYLNIQ